MPEELPNREWVRLMRGGALRHLITIQVKSASADTLGTKVHTWVTFAQVHAEKDPKNGRDFFAENKPQDTLTTVWRMRYLDSVTAKMRVLSPEGDPYEIVGRPVDVKGRNREMFILTIAGVRDGR